MFTGIITALGSVRAIEPIGGGKDMRLVITAPWPDTGDIALGAAPPDAPGWRIEKPGHRPDNELLYLSNCGVTTSGASSRYLEIDGRRYSHIVDPRSGMGLTHRYLVTVQAPDATSADAWATAISVGGENAWKTWKKRHPELQVWIVQTDL